MQKDVKELIKSIDQAEAIRRRIYEDGTLDDLKFEIDMILDEYLDILLNAKVRI